MFRERKPRVMFVAIATTVLYALASPSFAGHGGGGHGGGGHGGGHAGGGHFGGHGGGGHGQHPYHPSGHHTAHHDGNHDGHHDHHHNGWHHGGWGPGYWGGGNLVYGGWGGWGGGWGGNTFIDNTTDVADNSDNGNDDGDDDGDYASNSDDNSGKPRLAGNAPGNDGDLSERPFPTDNWPELGVVTYAGQYGASEGQVIVRVVPGSPAAKAGLVSGDVILTFNGQPVPTADNLDEAMEAANGKFNVSVWDARTGRRSDISGDLDGATPPAPPAPKTAAITPVK